MLCRLCLIDSTEVLNIFEGDGEQLQIADIIGQHFWFVPIKDDQISNICCTCWLKVDEFHQFYCFIKDAQKKLSEIFLADQKSHKETTRSLLKKENDTGEDEWMHHAAVKDIDIKSEQFDNDESNGDNFEEVKDSLCTDNTNQNINFVSKIQSKTCDNDNSNISSKEKTSLKTNDEKNKARPKKRSPNKSDSEEDLPLKHFVEQKSKQDKNEKSEYLEKSKEKDDIIANYMKLKCEICLEEFTTFTQISQHYRTNHNTKGYVVCCNKKLYRRFLLFDHVNKHLNSEYFKCDECNKTFSDNKCLKNHIRKKHCLSNLEHFKCEKCNKTFSDKAYLKCHMLRHDKWNFECNQCHEKFPKESLLIRHKIIHVPAEERQFPCDDCGKAFSTKYSLQKHCRFVHENAYGRMCHICAKVIVGKSLFEKHQLEHVGIVEPKVQCEKCGLWVKHKYNLKKHMNLHNDRLFIHKCEICGKISPTKKALRSHLKYVHESERTHQCGICNKAFKRSLTLKEHMTTHTGEILYTCPHCPKTFNSNANLHAHRKKMHKNEWEESRKDRGVPLIGISDATFNDDKNNQNCSIEDNAEDDSHKLSENKINVDNAYNEQNAISSVLHSMQSEH